MSHAHFRSSRLRRALANYGDAMQLAVLRRVIAVNRALHRARLWLEPPNRQLLILPAAFTVGVVAGFLRGL